MPFGYAADNSGTGGGATTQNLAAINNALLGGSPPPDPKSTDGLLYQILQSLLAIQARLVPPQVFTPVVFSNASPGFTRSIQLGANTINGILATVTTGTVSVFLQDPSEDAALPPDFWFPAGPTIYIPFPSQDDTQVWLVSSDAITSANSKVYFVSY